MDSQPTAGPEYTIASIVAHVAEAVSQRAGESRQRQDERARAATRAIMEFRPSDTVEAMLASHCLMFHEMVVAEVHHAFCDEDSTTRRAAQSRTLAMDKAFGANFIRLKQHRAARQQETETQPAEDCTETEIVDRIRRHESQIEPGTPDVTTAAVDPERSEADASTETWPATAQISGLNRQARRALDRQIRKRAPALPRQGVTPDRNEATTTASATSAG
jgi:hypothetical protein